MKSSALQLVFAFVAIGAAIGIVDTGNLRIANQCHAQAPKNNASVKRTRVQLLRQVYDQRKRLLDQKEVLEGRIASLNEQMRNANADYARAAREAQAVQQTIGKVAQALDSLVSQQQTTIDPIARANLGVSIEQLRAEGRALQQRYAVLDADATKANVIRGGIAAEIASVTAKINDLYAEAFQLRSQFLDLVDPFGRFNQGEQEAALTALSEWIVLDGQNMEAYLARGAALWSLGRFAEALADFNRAVELEGPPGTLAIAFRGGLLHETGSHNAGMADLGRSIKADKRNWIAYLFRGLARWREGKHSAIEQDLITASRLATSSALPYCYLALFQSAYPIDSKRDARKAMEAASKAVSLDATNWLAYYARAAAFAEANNFDAAVLDAIQASDLANGKYRTQCLSAVDLFRNKKPLRMPSP